MNISLEQIDELRRRANVGYEEAKDALEKSNGDIVEALVYLERQHKGNYEGNNNREYNIRDSIRRLIRQGQETRFTIKKNDNTVVNVPVNAVVLTTVVMPPVTIFGGLAALFTGHRMRFVKRDGGDMEINRMMDKMADAADNMKDQMNK